MTIKNINIYNMYPAILGIRNSYKSKEKSDSQQEYVYLKGEFDNTIFSYNHAIVGNEDEKLIKKLLRSSSERKFLRQILISMDIKGSIKFWAQLDTYKVGTIRMSESTIHCITIGNVAPSDFEKSINDKHLYYLNDLIRNYNTCKNIMTKKTKKQLFEQIDANLPAGYVLESHWSANYEVLRKIYQDRKNHKMYWWQEFCEYLSKLPYFDLLISES